MTSNAREALRAFIATQNGRLAPVDIGDRTPLVERGILTSLMVADVLLFLEELRGAPVDAARLRPGSFKDLDTIVTTFLQEPA